MAITSPLPSAFGVSGLNRGLSKQRSAHEISRSPELRRAAADRVGACERALGGVDSRDSLLGANQIQGCFWGGSLGCDGTVGVDRRGVGADSAADHRPA